MKCTSCGSDNTQRLQVIYEGGTQTLDAQSAYGNVRATTQSTLARKATPPKKRHWTILAIVCLISLRLAVAFGNQREIPGITLFLLGSVLHAAGWRSPGSDLT